MASVATTFFSLAAIITHILVRAALGFQLKLMEICSNREFSQFAQHSEEITHLFPHTVRAVCRKI